jgi:molecular chaperone DnaK (HSP70)
MIRILTRKKLQRSTITFKAALVACNLAILAGCADQKPLQAQIDSLSQQLDQLQRDAAVAAANTAADNASTTVELQKSVSQLQSATQSNAKAIAALNDKIDRMFKRPVTEPPPAEQ